MTLQERLDAVNKSVENVRRDYSIPEMLYFHEGMVDRGQAMIATVFIDTSISMSFDHREVVEFETSNSLDTLIKSRTIDVLFLLQEQVNNALRNLGAE